MSIEAFEGVKNISLNDLILDEKNEYQMRYKVNADMISAIQESLKEGKIIEPIAVTISDNMEKYIIIDGQHRFIASKNENKSDIPAVFVDKERAKSWGYSANILRTDYNCVEKAKALDKLQKIYGLNNVQLAKKVGLKPNTVGDYLVILKLNKKLLDSAINLENYSMKKLGYLARRKNLSDDERYDLFIKDATKKYDMTTGKLIIKKERKKPLRNKALLKIRNSSKAEEILKTDIEILRKKLLRFEFRIKKFLSNFIKDENSERAIFEQFKQVCSDYDMLEKVLLTLPPKKVPIVDEKISKKISNKARKEAIVTYDEETGTKTYNVLNIPSDTEISTALENLNKELVREGKSEKEINALLKQKKKELKAEQNEKKEIKRKLTTENEKTITKLETDKATEPAINDFI